RPATVRSPARRPSREARPCGSSARPRTSPSSSTTADPPEARGARRRPVSVREHRNTPAPRADAPVRRGRARGAGAGADGRAAGLDGVSWAEVNAVTGNVLIAYAEREVNLGTLVDTVRDVEEAHRAARDD